MGFEFSSVNARTHTHTDVIAAKSVQRSCVVFSREPHSAETIDAMDNTRAQSNTEFIHFAAIVSHENHRRIENYDERRKWRERVAGKRERGRASESEESRETESVNK